MEIQVKFLNRVLKGHALSLGVVADPEHQGLWLPLQGAPVRSRALLGPPRKPKIMALSPKVESIGSRGSIILAILEVQVCPTHGGYGAPGVKVDPLAAASSNSSICWPPPSLRREAAAKYDEVTRALPGAALHRGSVGQ